MKSKYSQLLSSVLAREDTENKLARTTNSKTVRDFRSLDSTSVIKASLALSGEIILGRLLEKLMRIVLENEGETKSVDIHQGIDSTLVILQHRLKIKSKYCVIKIVKEYGDLPAVECHAGSLNQVFMNILSNAIDAIEEGLENEDAPSPSIWIRTQVLDGNQVIVRIADNGPGMTPEVQQRLFDPFFTTKLGKGTGLGLSISYQIVVDKHGGQLTCSSNPGVGTEFLISIPI